VSALRRAPVGSDCPSFVISLYLVLGVLRIVRSPPQRRIFSEGLWSSATKVHPPSQAGFEGFEIDGGTYLYFGPVLALLRLPVLLVTHRLDGRMTQLSMLLALVILLGATGALYEAVRRLVRPDAATVGRAELALAFLVTFTVGAGGVVLYLPPPVVRGDRAVGAAPRSPSRSAVIERPTSRGSPGRVGRDLTVSTRVAVGLGPIVALACLTAASAACSWPRRCGAARQRALAAAATSARCVLRAGGPWWSRS
jgi:hypothetical protein